MIMLPCRKNTAPGVLLLYARLYINTLFFIEFYFAAHVSFSLEESLRVLLAQCASRCTLCG